MNVDVDVNNMLITMLVILKFKKGKKSRPTSLTRKELFYKSSAPTRKSEKIICKTSINLTQASCFTNEYKVKVIQYEYKVQWHHSFATTIIRVLNYKKKERTEAELTTIANLNIS